MRRVLVASAILLAPGLARAEGERLLGDDTFAVRSTGGLWVDGGVVVGLPAALATGLTTGLGGGVTRDCSCWWSYGARASWSTATESSLAWTVNHMDLRLRASGAIRHVAGRGTIALRLSLGPTFVREARDRNQGMRAGLTGSELGTTSLATLPAAELEAVVALHVTGPWLMVVSAGPALDVHDGGLHGGWTAGMGVAWQP